MHLFLHAGCLVLMVTVQRTAGESLPYKTWMSKFQKTLIVNLPVIPGSHDSGAVNLGENPTWQGEALWSYARTQSLSITEQLDVGIRFLDIRLHVIKDEVDLTDTIAISHTYDSDLTLVECLSEISAFLSANPSELILLYLRIDTAHPLTGNVDSKKLYIEQVLIDSGISFAPYSGSDIKTVKVSDVAGSVMLLAPDGSVLPSTTSLSFVDSSEHYDVCSIYQDTTRAQAQVTLSTCFPIVPTSGSISGVITGYAIDGQLNSLPPAISSIEMNDWFFANFKSNPTWTKREKYPVQVVLFDFVDKVYMDTLLSYATGIDPNSLTTDNSDTVDVSSKGTMDICIPHIITYIAITYILMI